MPAVIRVSAVYTLSDQVSSKLKRMTARAAALEKSMNNVNSKFDNMAKSAKKVEDPLKRVNNQLGDMKKTIGTTKSTSGLLYRIDQLQKRMGKLAPKRGHQIRVSTTGVKASERELDRLAAKVNKLHGQRYSIKIEVDKDTANILRDQANALDRVSRSVQGVKIGLGQLRDGEAGLRKTMRAKTQAAEQQRVAMSKVERQISKTTKETGHFRKSVRRGNWEIQKFRVFLDELSSGIYRNSSAFRHGMKAGAGFMRMFPFIAGGVNVVGVALGGLTSMLHGLVTPLLAVTSHAKDMTGVIGLMPAVFAAAGAAAMSFGGAMNAFFGDALANGKKLAEIRRKLETASGDDRKTLLEQEKKLLGEMNKEQVKLATGVADLGKKWREVFTSNEKLQKRFFSTAHFGLTTATKLLDRYRGDLQRTADAVRQVAHRFFQVLRTNTDLHKGIKAAFRIAQALAGNLRDALDPLMTFFGRLLQASERPVKRIGNVFERWAKSLARIDVQRMERFFNRALRTTGMWWRVLKNLGAAFSNIFRAGQDESDGFLVTLERVTRQFKFWTGGRGMPLIRREWKQGMRVAKALGRVLKGLTFGFMGMGGDETATDSVVEFLDSMARGMEGLFKFLSDVTGRLGPAMTRFFQSFGGRSNTLSGLTDVLIVLFDALSALNELLNRIPDPLERMMGWMIGLKLAAHAAGGVVGTFIAILAGGMGTLSNAAKHIGGIGRGMKAVAQGKIPFAGMGAGAAGTAGGAANTVSKGSRMSRLLGRAAGPINLGADLIAGDVHISNTIASPVPVLIVSDLTGGRGGGVVAGGGGGKGGKGGKGGRGGRLARLGGRMGRFGAPIIMLAGAGSMLKRGSTVPVPKSGFARQSTIADNLSKTGHTGLGRGTGAMRGAGKVLKPVPVVGTALGVGMELTYGEGSLKKRAGRAGAGTLGAIGGGAAGGAAAGALLSGPAAPIGAAIGAIGGAVAGWYSGSKVYDAAMKRFEKGTETFEDKVHAMGFKNAEEYKKIDKNLRQIAEKTGMTADSLKELDKSIKRQTGEYMKAWDPRKLTAGAQQANNELVDAAFDAKVSQVGKSGYKTDAMFQLAALIEKKGAAAGQAEWAKRFPELVDNTSLINAAIQLSADRSISEISNMRQEHLMALQDLFGGITEANTYLKEMKDAEVRMEAQQAVATAMMGNFLMGNVNPNAPLANQLGQLTLEQMAAGPNQIAPNGQVAPPGMVVNPNFGSNNFATSGTNNQLFVPMSRVSASEGGTEPTTGGTEPTTGGSSAQPSAASAGLAPSAVTGRTAAGLTVGFDKGSLATFEANVTKVRKGLDKLQVGKFFMSRPLKVALQNAITNLKTFGQTMVREMDTLGQNLTSSVNKWAGEVKSALNSMAPGITVSDIKSALGIGGGSSSGTGSSSSSSPSVEKKAGGGFVVPGDPRRPDSVMVMLKPGEVVLNEGQQQKLGRAMISKSLVGPGTAAKGTFGFNMMDAPSSSLRMAGGGLVPELQPYINAATSMGGTITSGFRPGDITKSGNLSNHATGHAIDIGGSAAVMSKIYRAFLPDAMRGALSELFYDPLGGWSRGRSIGPIGGHSDHVHAAVAAGAIAAIGGFDPVNLPKPPKLGITKFGIAAQAPTDVMHAALQYGAEKAQQAMFGGMGHSFDQSMPGSPMAIGQELAAGYGWTGGQWRALKELWRRESNWNPFAENPYSGAYGIPQALPPTKMPRAAQKSGGSSASAQIGWGLNYIQDRYGSPQAALAFHDRMNWYGNGGFGYVDKPQLIGVGDKPEHVQITPARTEAKPGGTIQGAGSAGARGVNITNNFYIGSLSGDKKSLQELAAMVGDVIADDLDAASRTHVSGSREVMTGNG